MATASATAPASRDVAGKSSRRRYLGKLHHLLGSGLPRHQAVAAARAYAGGKTSPRRQCDEPGGALYRTADGHYRTVTTLPLQLAEVGDFDPTAPIQIARCGRWQHPVYGEFAITPQVCDELARNFSSRVRGVDIAIDENHEPDHRAVGWVRQVESRGADGLWATVEWTARGLQLLKDRTYRYFSPEFGPYEREDTGERFGNVLYGGALTNRPFLKEMAPVALAEGDPMVPVVDPWDVLEAAAGDLLRALAHPDPAERLSAVAAVAASLADCCAYEPLDDPEDATEDQDTTALPAGDPLPALTLSDAATEAAQETTMADQKTTAAAPENGAPLALAEAQIVALREQLETERKALAEQRRALAEQQITARIDDLCRPDARGVVRLTPAEREPNLKLCLALNEQMPTLADTFLAALAVRPGISLKEVGTTGNADGATSATAHLEAAIKALTERQPTLTRAQATVAALNANPDLYTQYLRENPHQTGGFVNGR